MKFLVAVFCFLPFLSPAQDCSLKDVKDPLNQDTRLSTGGKKFGAGNDRFMLSGEADKNEIDFFFMLDNSSLCFDPYSRLTVIFEGGKLKGNYRSGGAENCKGYFHVIFKNQANHPAALKNLAEKKVISLKFTAADRKTIKEITLTPEEQNTLMKMASCILSESAALLNDTWKPKQ